MACTRAWAPRWPGWRAASPSRRWLIAGPSSKSTSTASAASRCRTSPATRTSRCAWPDPLLEREHLGDDAVGGVGAGAFPRDGTVVEEHDAVAQLQRVSDELLDDQQRRALLAQCLQAGVDLLDDDRRQPERELVGDEHLRTLDEDAGHRQHPLLTAGERSGDLLPALPEHREQVVRTL